ncbi:uncharacterized protein LOC122505830 [Leptopilina heterotoma]|uniref:uncharacterized protein LOC122505830 n=1 Tax=Leptopilina heterotoma TaxID=63436 RepID=UPI001CA8D8CE|nr:uncharacterized protein LOC122505830 [Leptopilina heterotoma]
MCKDMQGKCIGSSQEKATLKYRPIYCIAPKVTERDTTACVNHENFLFLVKTLHGKKSWKKIQLIKFELQSILKHEFNILHQYNVSENLKNNLKDNECFILVDFSENYSCKYGTEVQSVHFGANRQQLTIHTGKIWTTRFDTGFATVSESLRHDAAAAVMAHLQNIVDFYLPQLDNVKTLHFMSDGPTTQYKNRTMFYLITQLLPKCYSQIKRITYNFSESGHGKGPADGIGAALKRICDDEILYGRDITDLNSFLPAVTKKAKKIHVSSVSLGRIEEIDKILKDVELQTFVGTRKIHQYTWSEETREVIYFNSLSCLNCTPGTICKHFSEGQLKYESENPNSTIKRKKEKVSKSTGNKSKVISSKTKRSLQAEHENSKDMKDQSNTSGLRRSLRFLF